MQSLVSKLCSTRKGTQQLAIILTASFMLHLGVALLSSHGIVQDDAISYTDIAKNLAHGNGFVFEKGHEETAWRAPGYPLFLSIVFRLTGDSEIAGRAANALLWTGTNLWVAIIAFSLLEPAAALIACGLVAFYPEFIGFSGLLWSESLSIFLFTASLAALVLLGVKRRWPFVVVAGVLTGACILTRSTFVVLLLLIVLAGLAGLLKRSQAVATILIALAVVAPWTMRNYRLLHRFVLVESNATMNLFAGSRPYAPMPFTFRVLKMLPDDPQYRAISKLTPSEQYAAFKVAAVQSIRANPGRFALLSVSKTFDFWIPDSFVSRNVAAGSYGVRYTRMWLAVLFITALTFLMICAGAIFTLVKHRRSRVVQFAFLMLVLYTLPHSLVYGASRYHLPLMPVICILAAPAFLYLFRRFGDARGLSETTSVRNTKRPGAVFKSSLPASAGNDNGTSSQAGRVPFRKRGCEAPSLLPSFSLPFIKMNPL